MLADGGKDATNYLCFSLEEFENEDEFSPAAFLVEKRRHVPIDTLVKDLKDYRDHLNDQVWVLVDTDVCDTFLSVTNKLYQRENDLLRLQAPLHDISSRVTSACAKLEASKEKVEEKLAKIEQLERAKTFAMQKLKIIVTEHKMRAALRSLHGADGQAPGSRPASPTAKRPSPAQPRQASPGTKDAEPASTQLSRLPLLSTVVGYAKQLEIDERFLSPALDAHKQDKLLLCGRISQLRSHVHSTLDSECASLLTRFKEGDMGEGVMEGLRACFEGFCELEREAECYAVFKNVIACPSAEETVSWSAASSSRDNPAALASLFAGPIELCTTRWCRITDAAHDAGLRFMVTALWQAFSDTFSKRVHFLFDSGNPHLFSKRYHAAHTLASALEGICRSRKALTHLRREMKLWESRWNLEVYFKMCEIAARAQFQKWAKSGDSSLTRAELLPAAATKNPDEAIPLLKEDFTFGPCCAAYSTLRWLASDSVMMYALGHRFLGLATSLMEGMRQWHSGFITSHGLPILNANGAIVSGERKDSKSTLVEGQTDVEVLVQLYLDLPTLKSKLREAFVPAFSAFYDQAEVGVKEAVATALDAVLSFCSAAALDLSAALTSLIAAQCIRILSDSVAHLPSQFRLRQKPVPEAANVRLIASAIDLFVEFRSALERNSCPAETIQGWSDETVSMVMSQYKVAIEDSQSKWRKQDVSLQKMLRGADGESQPRQGGVRRTAPPPVSEMTDFDKFNLQLFLDVQAFCGLLNEKGIVQAEGLGAYKRLRTAVMHGAWLRREPWAGSEEPA